MDSVIASTVIIGIIDAVKRQFPKVTGLYGIALSIILGIVAGYFQFAGVNSIENGILVGLSAAGIYKVASKVGGN